VYFNAVQYSVLNKLFKQLSKVFCRIQQQILLENSVLKVFGILPSLIFVVRIYIRWVRYRYCAKDDIISDVDDIYWQFVDTQQQRLALSDGFGVRFGVVLYYTAISRDHRRIFYLLRNSLH